MITEYTHKQNDEKETRYIVAARIATAFQNCIVVKENDALIGINALGFGPASRTHRRVFGPASREECEKWRAANCKSGI